MDENSQLRQRIVELEELLGEQQRSIDLIVIQHEIATELSAASDLNEGLRSCLDAAMRVSGMDCGGIYLLDDTSGALELFVHRDLSDAFIAEASSYDAESVQVGMVKEGKAIYRQHAQLGMSPAEAIEEEGLVAMGVLPIRYADRVIACMNVASHSREDVPEFSRLALETIGAQIGAAIMRLKTEEALKQKNVELDSFINNIPDMAWLKDRESNFIAANKAFGDAVGMEPAFLVNHTCEVCFGKDAAAKFKEDDSEVIESKRQIRIEESIVNTHGEMVELETIKSPILSASGEVAGTVGIARDISDRKRAEADRRAMEERVQKSERLESIGVMVGGIAHDLNNVLGPMISLPAVVREDIELLEDAFESLGGDISNVVDLAETRDDLRVIEDAGRRAAAVIRDLMTLSRRGTYDKEPLDINWLIQECLATREFMVLRGAKPRVLVDTTLHENIPLVRASAPHLQRTFSNLVRNSFDAMENRGRLHVETSVVELQTAKDGYELIPKGRYALVSVSDTGLGIEKWDLPRIFEPFFTGKEQSLRKGSGLGLSVVHGIVKDHHGFVDVVSEVGRGSAFDLYLPVFEDESTRVQDSDVSVGGAEHILVVDDEPGQLFLARRLLSRLGYQVTTAANGRQGVGLFQDAVRAKAPFDLVLIDMIMEEDYDGLETLLDIQQSAPDQKAIIVSGYAPNERVKEALARGADWLAKPYDLDQLARVLRGTIDSSE